MASTSQHVLASGLIGLRTERDDALKDCLTVTQRTLSAAEYAASPEFVKKLLEIPFKKHEPLYCVESSHPAVRDIQQALARNQPYHEFIGGQYGAVWPVLLRMAIDGLITPDQFHTMIKVSYWKALGLEVETLPFLIQTPEGKKGTHPVARQLFATMTSFCIPKRQEFLNNIVRIAIPNEQSVLCIRLNPQFVRCAIWTYTLDTEKERRKGLIPLLEQLKDYHRRVLGVEYNHQQTTDELIATGIQLFGNLLASEIEHYVITFVEGHPCFILPSHSFLKAYIATLNPTSELNYILRVGKFGPQEMEREAEQKMRSGNAYAPGTSAHDTVHRNCAFAALGLEHDDYHYLIVSLFGTELNRQLQRSVSILRSQLYLSEKFYTEVVRLVDRETFYYPPDPFKLYMLLAGAFSIVPGDPNSRLTLTAVFILIDITLTPKKWILEEVRHLSLLERLFGTKIDLKTFKSIVEGYKAQCSPTVLPIAVLAHFLLSDERLAREIIRMSQEQPQLTLHVWQKKPHGHAYPVLLLEGRDVTFDELATMMPAQRIELLYKSVALNQADRKNWNTELVRRIKNSAALNALAVEAFSPAVEQALAHEKPYSAVATIAKENVQDSPQLKKYKASLRVIATQWFADCALANLRLRLAALSPLAAEVREASASAALPRTPTSVEYQQTMRTIEHRIIHSIIAAPTIQKMVEMLCETMKGEETPMIIKQKLEGVIVATQQCPFCKVFYERYQKQLVTSHSQYNRATKI